MSRNIKDYISARCSSIAERIRFPLLGFAFVHAWNAIALSRLSNIGIGTTTLGWDLFYGSMIAVYFLGIAMREKISRSLGTKMSSMIAAGMLMASALCLFAWQMCALPIFAIAATIIGGLGSALSILLWAILQSRYNSLFIVVYVSGGFFFGAIFGWLFGGIDAVKTLFVLMALPLLSHVCILKGRTIAPESSLPSGARRVWTYVPWKLLLALCVYEFVLGMREALFQASMRPYSLGVIISSAALFLVVAFARSRFDFSTIFRTPFVFIVLGLLTTAQTFMLHDATTSFLLSVGYSLAFLSLTILMCDIAHRTGITVVFLCSIQGVVSVGMIGGHLFGHAVAANSFAHILDSQGISFVLIVIVLAVSMLLLVGKNGSTWGLSFFGTGSSSDEDEQGAFDAYCENIALEHGLSPREREVFLLLANGKNPPFIEQELCIASGTLKSHTRRIYQKLGIHSREELRILTGKMPQ